MVRAIIGFGKAWRLKHDTWKLLCWRYAGTFDRGRRPRTALARARRRIEQGARIGMVRSVKDPVDRSPLDNLTMIEDEHLVRQLGDHREVVADDEQTAASLLDSSKHAKNLGLHRRVESSGRFAGDHQRRIERESRGDESALA